MHSEPSAAPAAAEPTESPVSAPASAGATSPSRASEEPKEPNLFDRLFRRGKPEQADSKASQETKPDGKPASKPAAPQVLTVTPEELQRKAQSEADRIIAKRNQAAAEAEKKRLRDEDPYAYVDQVKAEEQQREVEQRFSGFLSGIGQQYDQHVLDPVMDRLPAADKERILKDETLGVGLEGRKATMQAALDVLLKQERAAGKADAEKGLRKNQAFRKQILSELRGDPAHDEPDLVPANGAVPGGAGMNGWIRESLGKSRYRGPTE